MALRSCTPGRERWSVPILKNNPPLAAAVELLLKGEEGVLDAQTSHLTGSVLVHYEPERIEGSVELLIRTAMSFGPLSRDEMSGQRSNTKIILSLVLGEFGCIILKSLFLSMGCIPAGAVATAAVLLFFHQRN